MVLEFLVFYWIYISQKMMIIIDVNINHQ